MKSEPKLEEVDVIGVTPCVGVWIEIPCHIVYVVEPEVTPCVGVWIEIRPKPEAFDRPEESLPAWECGLKLPEQGL